MLRGAAFEGALVAAPRFLQSAYYSDELGGFSPYVVEVLMTLLQAGAGYVLAFQTLAVRRRLGAVDERTAAASA